MTSALRSERLARMSRAHDRLHFKDSMRLWTAIRSAGPGAMDQVRSGGMAEGFPDIAIVHRGSSIRVAASLLFVAAFVFPGSTVAADGLPGMELEWSLDLKEPGISHPVHFWKVERARGVLVTLASGTVVLVDPRGHVVASARLDLPSESPAVAGELLPGQGPAIVAADVCGSLYTFNEKGERLWKFPRLEKARDLRLPVLGDLDGDGNLDIVMTDSRGHLYALDGNGRPKLEVTATRYRAGTPSIGDVNGDGKPEILFGTDDGDVHALDRRGGVLWSAKLEARFGRSLPLVADADHDGNYEVYIPTSFNARGAGLFALHAATGKLLWKADSTMQSYRSTAVTDLDGDGSEEVLFGDKNTRLYCLDARGVQRWSTQMDGRGIFSAPAVADLEGSGQALIFAVVRGAGVNGQSLHVLDAVGKLVRSLPLPGGGAGSPILCRFEGRKDVTLLVLSGGGQLLCYRLPQKPEAVRILWPGLRNDALNSGFVPSRGKVVRAPAAEGEPRAVQLPVSLPRAEERPTQPVGTVRQIVNPWSSAGTLAPPGPLTASMLGNEYESAAIAVTHLEDRPLTLRLSCGPFRPEAEVVAAVEAAVEAEVGAEVAASKVIEFHEVLEVLPNTAGKPSEDALPRLGEAQTIHFGPRETRKIWLTLRSHDLPAGRHRATLRIGDPLSLAPPLEVPVHLTVHPVRLPERFTYRHCNWLNFSALGDEVQREAVIRDALDHGTNVFVIPAVTFAVDARGELGAPDGGLHDVLVRRLRGKAVFLVSGSAGLRWPDGANPDPGARERVWAEAVRRYAVHMRGLGCSHDDWAFYLQDEPGLNGPDAHYDAYVELVKRVKAADPRARIYANPAGGARAGVLQPIKDLIDIWSPDLHLVREDPEKLGEIFRRAKDYWHYEAPADQRNLDPLGFYRVKPWVAFQLGMNGGGYWVYHYQDLWLPDPAVSAEYGVVYLTGNGPVTTKRWEASRDGIEDYELLSMLRESAGRSKSAAAQEALALIDEAVAFVTRGQDQVSDISRQLHPYTPDYGRWMEYRDRLIQMQVRVSQER